MGLYTTEKCFFTGNDVISFIETNGECLDGYYYRILYNGRIRDIRLFKRDDWKNDDWIKQKGSAFLELLEETDSWYLFDEALKIEEIRQIFSDLRRK